ncbi:unnamed protein product [Oikopleura dioica]|uniref:phosphatidylserine decarboxylase n=1 Tax=Oikopleura dioica TaxID=34765 RepID=E4Y0D8_OIKDI|nr:unnamed protein product [Oikopleura dioica]
MPVPVFLRNPIYGAYGSAFGVKMEEAIEPDMRFYPSLNSFFRRAIRPDVRPIDMNPKAVVSPADGIVLHFGKCKNGLIEQVKGVDYSLKRFFGRWEETGFTMQKTSDAQFAEKLKVHSENELYQIVIYLAPGDYHRFHSPADFTITSRRHYPGDLFSVNPKLASFMRDLFVLNERATFFGEWAHGFMSYCAVGATNVGSIIFHYDPEMVTNINSGRILYGAHADKDFTLIDPRLPDGLPVEKGEMLGEFNLGSTIVLVFEAPKSFEFNVSSGDKVLLGQKIGEILSKK